MKYDYSEYKKRFNVYLSEQEYNDFVFVQVCMKEKSLNQCFLKMLKAWKNHFENKAKEEEAEALRLKEEQLKKTNFINQQLVNKIKLSQLNQNK